MGDPLGPQPCRRCGLPADLLGPDGLCGPCRAATIADERLALLRALGMPPEAPLSLYERTEDFREPTTPVPSGQAWMKGADWEFLGLCVPAPPVCPGPILRDPAYLGQFLVQLWRVRVYHRRSALWW